MSETRIRILLFCEFVLSSYIKFILTVVFSAKVNNRSARWKNTSMPISGTSVMIMGVCSEIMNGLLTISVDNIVHVAVCESSSTETTASGSNPSSPSERHKFPAAINNSGNRVWCVLHYINSYSCH